MSQTKNFVIYADLNCPFCFALNERLHYWNIEDRVEWRPVQHAPAISSRESSFQSLCELTNEVIEVRRRSPNTEIRVPSFRPNSGPGSQLLVEVGARDRKKATQLRRSLYRILWQDGKDISDPALIETLATEVGIAELGHSEATRTSMELWQRQWENGAFNRSIPVISDSEGNTLIGFPVQEELDAILTGAKTAPGGSNAACLMKPRQCLYVTDNDPLSLQMVIAQLPEYELHILEDCNDLLARLEQGEVPDLVLVDSALFFDQEAQIQARLGGDCSSDSIPFVLASTQDQPQEESRAFQVGAADFIRKPYHPKVLKARLTTQLELKRSRGILDRLVRLDSLTEICNRREFDVRLQLEWNRCLRSGDSVALLMIDIDRFKQYNDHYGHSRGDECLRSVAKLLNQCIHRPADLLARYGGEEFAILLPEIDLGGATVVARRCKKRLAQARIVHEFSDLGPHLTLSLGLAVVRPVDEPGVAPQVLIERSDRALYRAKGSGRNRIEQF